LSDWRQLLDRTLHGLAELERQGHPVPDWVLGGGTALMIFADHRLSRDIDAFIDDPQYLALLSPETADVWNCSAWDRAAHYLKLKYPEGEIDFIISAPISSLPPIERKNRPDRDTEGIETDDPARPAGGDRAEEASLPRHHAQATRRIRHISDRYYRRRRVDREPARSCGEEERFAAAPRQH
jgi:hypothetical protein